jgi:hypothetical protein
MQLNPAEQLDAVLNFLFEKNDNIRLSQIQAAFNEGSGKYIHIEDLKRIVNKLVKDGFCDFHEMLSEQPYDKLNLIRDRLYYISFEGKLLRNSGGYVQKERNVKLQSEAAKVDLEIRKRNERRLVVGTYLVAIGAIALVIWEVIKTFLIEHH